MRTTHVSPSAAPVSREREPSDTTRPKPVDSVKVLFVSGTARSGTTLLDLLLGQMPSFVVIGELRYLWQRGLVEGRLCGCGEPVASCEFWKHALARSRATESTATPIHMVDLLTVLERPATVIDMFRTRRQRTRDVGVHEVVDHLADLYRAVAEQSHARVIVDSSKPPTYGWLLQMAPTIDLHIVHIVRDPRACAFSLQRQKLADDRPEGGLMRRQRPWKGALTWDLWNLAAEKLAKPDASKYLQIRYEDLVCAPTQWLRRIVRLVGVDETEIPDIETNEPIKLRVSHTVAGNPVRLAQRIEIRLDREWTERMNARQRRVVETITAPVMAHYGYPLSVANTRSSGDSPTRTAHRADGLVVELVGLPGAGKSHVAAALLERLNQQGTAARDANRGIGPQSAAAPRLFRKARLFTRELVSDTTALRTAGAIAIATRQQPGRDRIARPLNLLVACQVIRKSRHFNGVSIMDQGVLQEAWSTALRADRDRALTKLCSLLPHAPLPDLVIYLDLPRDILIGRLESRPTCHSRVQRQSGAALAQELTHGARLFGAILALVAGLPEAKRPRVLHVDGLDPRLVDRAVEWINTALPTSANAGET